MQVVEFNGLGEPNDASVITGEVLLLVQGTNVEVVKLELLPPDDFGPSLDHALNQGELANEAIALVRVENPECLDEDADRHFTLRCPESLAAKAQFRPTDEAT